MTRGFVDLHCHGAVGSSFDDADAEGVQRAIAHHRSQGTSSMLLSLVSAPIDRLARRMAELRPIVEGDAAVAGVHLEGPFLAPSRRGAHDPRALRRPDRAAVDEVLRAGEGVLRQITIAPELPGALDAVEAFVGAGVIVAVGHTEADQDAAAAAFDRGASLLTHTFNAMPGLHHRAPGPIGAALDRPHVVLEVIADTHHVHPTLLRTLFSAAPGRIALVTDAMSATGLGDGDYVLGGLDVTVTAGRPVLRGTDTLAGSTSTMRSAVDTLVRIGISPEEATMAATATPARILSATH